jgi:hypothetical protein
MLGGENRVDVDGLGWIDDDSLQAVFRESRHAILLPFGSIVQLNYLL